MAENRGQKRSNRAIGVCIICQKDCSEDRSTTTTESWETLRGYAKNWEGLDKFGTVYDEVQWENGPQGVFFHKLCRTQIASKVSLSQSLKRKKLEEPKESDYNLPEDTEGTSQRQSRSSVGPIHNKSLCVWCMQPEDKKHPKRDKWHIIQQLDAWNIFKGHTVYLEDESLRSRLISLIESTPDPFASEIRYHRSCWLKYIPRKSAELTEQNLHLTCIHPSEVKQKFFEHVRTVIFQQHEFRTLQSLLNDYTSMLNNFGFTSNVKSSTLKSMLLDEFQSKIGFHDRLQKNKSSLVFDQSAGGSYVEAALQCCGISDEDLFEATAKRLKSRIADGPKLPWPAHVEQLLDEQEQQQQVLVKFLKKLRKRPNADDECDDPSLVALASVLESYILGVRTPFQVKLSVTMHGLTRSREIVDLLKSFSFGISYKDVLHLYDAWAKHDITENTICPAELGRNIPGAAIMDNDDFSDDTLTGANTSHRTNVMFVQPESAINILPLPKPDLQIPSSAEVKQLCLNQHVIQPYSTIKRGEPAERPEVDLTAGNTDMQRQRGVIHSLVRLNENFSDRSPESQKIGAFAGFQTTVQPAVEKSKPYYFLTFPSPPNKTVVHEVMCRVTEAAKAKDMPFILLVGDQPVYAHIVQIKYEHPDEFSVICPFIGPFHMHCSFMSAMHKRFHGSGLSDLLVAAGVIAEGSVEQALRGKHYKRGMRCLRLMYETLIRRLVKLAVENGRKIQSDDVKANLQVLQDSSASAEEHQHAYTMLEDDSGVMDMVSRELERIEHSDSSMARFWLSFLIMTEILMMNFHALRTQNWNEFKASVRLMIPWLQVYDNTNYGRWLVEFWLEMESLPEAKAHFMSSGLFAQSMTGKPYSCLPLDMWIEMTMNKGSKLKAGWLKILKNEKMLLTHTRTVNIVNKVRSSLHCLAKSSESEQAHNENAKTRRTQDEKAVQDLLACFEEFQCDPFSLDNTRLRTLMSGVYASDNLLIDFESAQNDGENQFTTFCKERMFSSNKSFHSNVKRNVRSNFSHPPTPKEAKPKQHTKSEAMENRAMASVVEMAEKHNDKFVLADIMEYRVTDECLPIFNINGTMRKTQKSKQIEILHLESLQPPAEYTAIVDMGFIWRLSLPSAEKRNKYDGSVYTWAEYASDMLSIILRRHKSATTLVLVNDPYDLPYSIKDSERIMRATKHGSEGTRNIFIRAQESFPSHKLLNDLFASPTNKQRLQAFLKNQFRNMSAALTNKELIYSVGLRCENLTTGTQVNEYECNHIEADTAMFYIYSQIRKDDPHTVVILDSEDTDVVVLAAHVAHRVDGVLGLKRRDTILDSRLLCAKDTADVIIPLYVHSGCDTTAAFYGHGKRSVFEKGVCTEAQQMLRSVGCVLPASNEVLDNMAIFTIRYIYGDKASKTLGQARAVKWKSLKQKSTLRIPPDRDSHNLKVQRVNYQSYIFLNFDKKDMVPSPLHNGWTLENEKCVPLRYSKPALPPDLLVTLQNVTEDDMSISDGSDEDSGCSDTEDD